jgi:hypothetical protein
MITYISETRWLGIHLKLHDITLVNGDTVI